MRQLLHACYAHVTQTDVEGEGCVRPEDSSRRSLKSLRRTQAHFVVAHHVVGCTIHHRITAG